MEAAELTLISAGFATGGAAVGALAKAWSSGRKIDKVDAVVAISKAYELVIHRLEVQIDNLQHELNQLRDEMRRKDELFERLLERVSTPTAVLPVPLDPPRHVRKTDT